MVKQYKFLKTYKSILEELMRVQQELEDAAKDRNEVLVRLFETDVIRIRERLKIDTCDLCYYGKADQTPYMCEYWDRCNSSVKLVKILEEEDFIQGEFALVFKLNIINQEKNL